MRLSGPFGPNALAGPAVDLAMTGGRRPDRDAPHLREVEHGRMVVGAGRPDRLVHGFGSGRPMVGTGSQELVTGPRRRGTRQRDASKPQRARPLRAPGCLG